MTPLARMRVYQLARQLIEEAWPDAEALGANVATEKTSGQLYAAVGSIAANLGEGYSRSSGRDRVRIFEYALGSARESMSWYRTAEPILGAEIVRARLDKLEETGQVLRTGRSVVNMIITEAKCLLFSLQEYITSSIFP